MTGFQPAGNITYHDESGFLLNAYAKLAILMLFEEVGRRMRLAGVRANRDMSQHFLTDDTVLGMIIRKSEKLVDGVVVEIGAGLGTLTEALCKRAKSVIAYEPDEKMARFLMSVLPPKFKNLEIREKFINRYELDRLVEELAPTKFSLVSNLPYSITSEFLLWLIANSGKVLGAVIMIQNEVAKRLTASPGSKAYGALSVFAQTFVSVNEIMFVPRTAFYPVPQVDSALVSIYALPNQPSVKDWDKYFRLISGAFKHRRKTISNAIGITFPHLNRTQILKVLSRVNILADRRGDTLSREEFLALSDELTRTRKVEGTIHPPDIEL